MSSTNKEELIFGYCDTPKRNPKELAGLAKT